MENPFIIETGEQTYIPSSPSIIGVINRAALIAAINRNDPRRIIARLSDPDYKEKWCQ